MVSQIVFLRLTLLVLLASITISSTAQNVLLFTKNRNKDATYRAGDIITFKIKGNPSKITDQIRDFEDSTIIFQYYKVHVTEITDIYRDKKTKDWWFLKYKYDELLLVVGTGYLAVDWINQGEIQKETAIFSASCIGAGLLAHWLISERIPIKGKKRLTVMTL